MLKKKLLAERKSRELKNLNFVSKTAKALLIVILFAAVFLIGPLVLTQNEINSLKPLELSVLPNIASAADIGGLTNFGEATILPTVSLGVVVARIINAALGLLGLVAVIIILYAGFLWMTAQGAEEKVAKAKKLLVQAVIGLLIIIMAFAIAQFIFWMLGINPWGGGGGGGGGETTYTSTGGALGAGIIRIVYPAPNAHGVPRNTKIGITFKIPICNLAGIAQAPGALIKDANGNGILGDCVDTGGNADGSPNGIFDAPIDKNGDGRFNANPTDGDTSECDLINPNVVKIRKKADLTGPYLEFVKAWTKQPINGGDLTTFTFTPVEYLGNDQTPNWYTVALTSALRKAGCSLTNFAFGSGGYNWSFEVSTVLDLEPPKIESVIPRAIPSPFRTVARNTVIQINFNEAIDPTTLAGKLDIVGEGKTGALKPTSYNLMTVKDGNTENDYVAGEFYFSNQYRTVEFITNDPCGTNSCGNQIYCLPGKKDISVLINAATLAEASKPTAREMMGNLLYDGIVDMCSNSLNGNKDTTPEGPAHTYDLNVVPPPTPTTDNGDNATWKFKTNDLIDLIPPQIETRNPENKRTDVDPDADLKLSFDKILLSSSLIQGELLADGESLALDQSKITNPQEIASYWFEKSNNDTTDKTTVIIKTTGLQDHYPYGPYNLIANSNIKDDTQNCYLPCADCPAGVRPPDPKCHCNRSETTTPGQYEVGSPWTPGPGNYPTCNLGGNLGAPPTYTCTGTGFGNATACPAPNATGLITNTNKTLVDFCSNDPKKCEYICSPGYTLSGGSCSPSCAPGLMYFDGGCVNIGFYGYLEGDYSIKGSYRLVGTTTYTTIGTSIMKIGDDSQKYVSITLPSGEYNILLERVDTNGGNMKVALRYSSNIQQVPPVSQSPIRGSSCGANSGYDYKGFVCDPFTNQNDSNTFILNIP